MEIEDVESHDYFLGYKIKKPACLRGWEVREKFSYDSHPPRRGVIMLIVAARWRIMCAQYCESKILVNNFMALVEILAEG